MERGNILNHCKDLRLKLSNDKDPNDRDIDGTENFKMLHKKKIYLPTTLKLWMV
jgi:hypothetical protein